MLSEKVQKNIATINRLLKETELLIEEETNGKLSLCTGSYPQLYACHTATGALSLSELEAFVGPAEKYYTYEDGRSSYRFELANTPCVILMPLDTPDAPTGGASNDVSAD